MQSMHMEITIILLNMIWLRSNNKKSIRFSNALSKKIKGDVLLCRKLLILGKQVNFSLRI